MKRLAASLSLALAAVCAFSASAQTYPDRPVRVMVGFAAGGGTDVLARLVCQKISDSLGQPFLVENRLGNSGMISAETVAKSKPDGYALLFAPSAIFTTNPVIYSKVPYSPTRDFVPVSEAVSYPFLFIASAAQPIGSMKELLDYARAHPDKANYSGSAGIFQLALELLKARTGVKFQYIPYKGTNEAINAVMAGDVLLTMGDTGPASGPLKGGKVRALAVTSPKRLASYPDVPTMEEAGSPDMVVQSWAGLFAPAGTPAAIVKKLQDEVARAVKLPDVRERMAALQVEPEGSTSEEFARLIASDLARWREVARIGNITPQD